MFCASNPHRRSLTTLSGVMSWWHDAACSNMDPALWFPLKSEGNNHGTEAKRVCAGCPVVEDCLLDSVERREEFGIWGGAGEQKRRRLVRDFESGDPAVWVQAFGNHLRSLRGERVAVVDANGPGASHGKAATYSRGCRCLRCSMAAGKRGKPSVDLAVLPSDMKGAPVP